ncbi:hypothetical protein MMC11_008343 [Xylographa trunciseda]|nr:hypothetical protein [Xylographa trunciseda]
MSCLEIPESYSALLSTSRQRGLNDIIRRRTNASSIMSTTSAVTEFVESKIDHASLDIKYVDEVRRGLKEAVDDGNLGLPQYKEAIKDMELYSRPKEQEIVVLTRQKKLIKDDLEEYAPFYGRLEDAYVNLIKNKVMGATAKRKQETYDQSRFKKAVVEFYGAARASRNNGIDQYWCHVTGWHLLDLVKAAHIVPKSLESDELSYLFGAGAVMLSDANNGIVVGTIQDGQQITRD